MFLSTKHRTRVCEGSKMWAWSWRERRNQECESKVQNHREQSDWECECEAQSLRERSDQLYNKHECEARSQRERNYLECWSKQSKQDASAKRDAWWSKATENASAKHKARGIETTLWNQNVIMAKIWCKPTILIVFWIWKWNVPVGLCHLGFFLSFFFFLFFFFFFFFF